MMQAQVNRENQRKQMSREDFLSSLCLKFRLFKLIGIQDPRFPRALELINKTNQFNTSGKRWTEQECVAAFAGATDFYVFEAQDRFTNYGIVGVLIVQGETISQFVMSCRVAGMDLEIAVIAELLRILRGKGQANVIAALIEIELNLLCRDVFQRSGFDNSDGVWHRQLQQLPEAPTHITLLPA